MDQGSTKKRSAVHNFVPTVTKFCVMWEGLSLPQDTKFGNCRDEIVDRRVIFIWSLIHGSSWSGLIKVGPGNKLTHFPLVPHIWVSELGQHWFRWRLVAYSVASHYLIQCWVIVNWTLRNKLQWNFNQNAKLFIHEIAPKISSVEWQSFCLGGDELGEWWGVGFLVFSDSWL